MLSGGLIVAVEGIVSEEEESQASQTNQGGEVADAVVAGVGRIKALLDLPTKTSSNSISFI